MISITGHQLVEVIEYGGKERQEFMKPWMLWGSITYKYLCHDSGFVPRGRTYFFSSGIRSAG